MKPSDDAWTADGGRVANGELVGTEVPELGLLSPVHPKPTDRRADGARRKFTHTHRALSPRAWVTGAARAAPSWGRACLLYTSDAADEERLV